MGNRLSKITTRTGDDGTTGLADGNRVAKHHPRIAAIGDVDELNSQMGLLMADDLPETHHGLLVGIQNDLFDVGGELAMPAYRQVSDSHLARLDQALKVLNADLPPLKEFILPGGCRSAAQAHVCRTVCRRAERSLVALSQTEPLAPALVQYLNRLSDLLFVLARQLNRHAGMTEPAWRGPQATDTEQS